MDTALKERVIEELRRDGYDRNDVELRCLAETVVGHVTALRIVSVDVYEVLTRGTWPGRLLMRLADVSSRALARLAHHA